MPLGQRHGVAGLLRGARPTWALVLKGWVLLYPTSVEVMVGVAFLSAGVALSISSGFGGSDRPFKRCSTSHGVCVTAGPYGWASVGPLLMGVLHVAYQTATVFLSFSSSYVM